MSSFTDADFEPVLGTDGKPTLREGRPLYRVKGGYYYEIGFKGSDLRLYVADGYITDGPSIPQQVKLLVPHSAIQSAFKAACIHDMLCEDTRFTLWEGCHIFAMAMEAEGTPHFWRSVFFHAVLFNRNRSKANADKITDEDVPTGDGDAGVRAGV